MGRASLATAEIMGLEETPNDDFHEESPLEGVSDSEKLKTISLGKMVV